jgi:hypothetical protein
MAVSARLLSSCVRREWPGASRRAPLFASCPWQELLECPPPARVATYVQNEVTCSNLSSFQPCTIYRTGWNEVVGPVIWARRRAGLQTRTRRMQGGE